MAYKTDDFRGEAQEGFAFPNEVGGEEMFRQVKHCMIALLKERRIPANVREDVLKSGGLFGSRAPILVISHPTEKYYDIGMYVNGINIGFPLLGESSENTKYNKKKYYEENGSRIKAAMIHPDELKLQQEIQWQRQVLDCFNDQLE